MGSACAEKGGGVKAYFEALLDPGSSPTAVYRAWRALTPSEWLRACLCQGGIGEKQFGFRAEVGRA
jgi:hypothetical protein